MRYIVYFTFLFCLTSCGGSGDISSCIQRGTEYYKTIGSWPRLSDGRDASSVVRERCSRTTTAF